MIQQPYYSLADLNEKERQAYDAVVKSRLQTLDKYKKRYCKSDVNLWLTKEMCYCRDVIREVAEAIELEQALTSIAQLSDCGTPPTIKQPSKWEYVYAVTYYDVFDRELGILRLADNNEQHSQTSRKKALKTFSSCICDPSKTETILSALHARLNQNTTGKELAVTIFAAIKAGLIIKPSFSQCAAEFQLPNRTTSRRNDYNKYYKAFAESRGKESDRILPEEIENLTSHFMKL